MNIVDGGNLQLEERDWRIGVLFGIWVRKSTSINELKNFTTGQSPHGNQRPLVWLIIEVLVTCSTIMSVVVLLKYEI